jgi:hypothetical protein
MIARTSHKSRRDRIHMQVHRYSRDRSRRT